MANLGTAYITIVPSAQGISGSITKTIAPEANIAGVKAGQGIATKLSGTLKSMGGGIMKAGGIATALSVPLIAGIKKSMDAYGVQKQAETKLTEIYKTRMGVTDQAAKKTIEYASALQKTGVVGDEVTLSGAQQLATFMKTPDAVNKLLPAMDNLLVQQKGYSATAQDATGIANMMGKVMGGQVGALKRVGITFDENSEKILKNGTEQEKAAELAKVITQNVGNMNAKFAETDEGKIQQMKNSLADLSEELGGAIAPVLSDIASFVSENLVPKVQSFMEMLQSNPVLARIIVGITGILAVGGPLLIIIGSIVSAVGALIPVVTAISAPMIAIAAGIAGLVAILVLAYQNSETFRTALQNAASAIGSALMPVIQMIIGKFQELMPVLVSIAKMIGDALGNAINFVVPIITTLISIVGEILAVAFDHLINILKKVASIFKTVGKVIGPPFQKASKVVANACKAITKYLTFKNIANTVSNVFKRIQMKIYNAIKTAQFKVNMTVLKIKRNLSFSGLVAKVSSTFNKIRDKIKQPIEKARNIVQGVVKKITGLFPLKIGKIFTGLKLPHINVSAGSPPFGIGGKGKKPSFSVSWNAKGGLYDGATLIGVGEAGPEAVIPLSGSAMRPFAATIAKEMNGNGMTNNFYITVNNADNPAQFADRLVREVKLRMRTA